MADIVSLVVGILPLLSLCCETVNKVQTFRGYKSDSAQLRTRFNVAKLRLETWKPKMRVVDGVVVVDPDDHLQHSDRIKAAPIVNDILKCINETFSAARKIDAKLQSRESKRVEVPPGWHLLRRRSTGLNRPQPTTHSTRAAISWTLKDKPVFADQVQTLEILVDQLYKVMPLSNGAVQPSLEGLREEILETVRQTRRIAVREARADIDSWLRTPDVDQRCEYLQEDTLEGTCKWIFEHTEYREWARLDTTNDCAKLLWISGPAGHGKSVLCSNIMHKLQRESPWPVAYFFSTAHIQATCKPLDIIRTWLSQLCDSRIQDSTAFDYIREKVITDLPVRRGTEKEIWALFESVVSELVCCTFILDGFDEFPKYDEEISEKTREGFLRRLLKALAIADTSTRVLICSRPEADIEEMLSPENNEGGALMLHCNIDVTDVEADVLLYSKDVVTKQLSAEREEFQQELAGQMAEKCDGMFLWIKLQKDLLRDTQTPAQLRRSVKSMPGTLTNTYARTWNDIMHSHPDDRRRAIEILRWACFALRPLTVAELVEALVHDYEASESCQDYLPHKIDSKYIAREIKALCGSLIELRPGRLDPEDTSTHTVHLVHVSAKEYLITVLPVPLPDPDVPKGASISADDHMHLAEVCVRYLVCKQTWEYEKAADSTLLGRQFLKYAIVNWAQHRSKASMISEELKRLTTELFSIKNKNFGKCINDEEFYRAPWTMRKREDGLNARLYMAIRFELRHVLNSLNETRMLDFSPTTFTCGSPLEMAAWRDDTNFERLIYWGADVNVETGMYGSALGAAIMARSLSKVRKLLENGSRTNIPDSQGKPPVFLACEVNEEDILELLLRHRANPDGSPNTHSSGLLQVINHGNSKAVKLLLKHDASIHVADEKGWTPLHFASAKDNGKIFDALLEKGASVSTKTIDGLTPLHIAARSGNYKYIQRLLERDADPYLRSIDSDNVSPFHLAVQSRCGNTTASFLDAGLSPDADQRGNQSALCIAIQFQSEEVMEVLVERGANLLKPILFGRTPFHWIQFIWPEHKEIEQWKARAGLYVRDGDCKYWLSRQICEVGQEMLDGPDSMSRRGFDDLGICFKYLRLWDDATFAFQRNIDDIQTDGTCRYRITCSACKEHLTAIRHVCHECPYVEVCDHCMESLPHLDQMSRCREHDFLHVVGRTDVDSARDLKPLQDPKVRTWLERIVANHSVDGDPPELAQFDLNSERLRTLDC